jgi:hypothetical protein
MKKKAVGNFQSMHSWKSITKHPTTKPFYKSRISAKDLFWNPGRLCTPVASAMVKPRVIHSNFVGVTQLLNTLVFMLITEAFD